MEVKPIDEFKQCGNSKYKDGFYAWCNRCRYAYDVEWRRKKRSDPVWHAKHCAGKRNKRFKDKYGLTTAEVEKMLVSQKNLCLLCGKPFTDRDPARVDHCHETGRIRGLLHSNCNSMIGFAKEEPALLRLAINYVQQHCRIAEGT